MTQITPTKDDRCCCWSRAVAGIASRISHRSSSTLQMLTPLRHVTFKSSKLECHSRVAHVHPRAHLKQGLSFAISSRTRSPSRMTCFRCPLNALVACATSCSHEMMARTRVSASSIYSVTRIILSRSDRGVPLRCPTCRRRGQPLRQGRR